MFNNQYGVPIPNQYGVPIPTVCPLSDEYDDDSVYSDESGDDSSQTEIKVVWNRGRVVP